MLLCASDRLGRHGVGLADARHAHRGRDPARVHAQVYAPACDLVRERLAERRDRRLGGGSRPLAVQELAVSDETFTMMPPRRSSIPGSTARVPAARAKWLTSMMAARIAEHSTLVGCSVPALLTRMSIRPCSRSTSASTCSNEPTSATSHTMVRSPPSVPAAGPRARAGPDQQCHRPSPAGCEVGATCRPIPNCRPRPAPQNGR